MDGPPIVFLHGFGTSKDAMMQLATEFGRRGWRAYAPDLPAFGEHAYHEGHVHDAAFYVHAVGAFMDAVGAPQQARDEFACIPSQTRGRCGGL